MMDYFIVKLKIVNISHTPYLFILCSYQDIIKITILSLQTCSTSGIKTYIVRASHHILQGNKRKLARNNNTFSFFS